MSPKKWIDATNAIGIVSKSRRYGGGILNFDFNELSGDASYDIGDRTV
jgi:hypothetical protein